MGWTKSWKEEVISLPDATKMALDKLSKNKDGFFLMVEGAQIDWAGHDNDADYLITELLDFDKTIGVALDFAANNAETLVIVTADHETGGFTLSTDDGDYNKIKPTFSTALDTRQLWCLYLPKDLEKKTLAASTKTRQYLKK